MNSWSNSFLTPTTPTRRKVFISHYHRHQNETKAGNIGCYARYYHYPQSKEELRGWIEDAYEARKSRAHLSSNPHDTMMGYNSRCRVCQVIH